MARRATYFFDVSKTSFPRLLVSGGWEYMRPGSMQPSETALRSLTKAYCIMGYDVGLLAREEAEALRENNILPNRWQATAETTPLTIVETENGDKIGFLRFPSLPEGDDIPSKQLIKSLTKRIEQERKNVRLLIALSDWGWVGEREYLAQDAKYVPDFLLGSGRGSGINGRVLADERCVWVRAYDKGRSIAEISIYEWPDRKISFAWKDTKNYNTTSIGLNDSIKDNPEVDALFR